MRSRRRAGNPKSQCPQPNPLSCRLWEHGNRAFTLVLVCREWNVPEQACGQSKSLLQINLNHYSDSVRRTGKINGSVQI